MSMTMLQLAKLERQRMDARLDEIMQAATTIDPDDPDVAGLVSDLKGLRKQIDHLYRTDWNCR